MGMIFKVPPALKKKKEYNCRMLELHLLLPSQKVNGNIKFLRNKEEHREQAFFCNS
jgi:hypothetical protein